MELIFGDTFPCKIMIEYANEGYFLNELSIIVINILMKFNTDLEGKMSFIFLDKIMQKWSLCN